MIKHSVEKLPKNTIAFKVTVSWDEIEKEYKVAFDHLAAELTVEGFRKGKAPKAIAEKHISKESAYNKLIHSMLPRIYEDIVTKEKVNPIISPKIELVKAKENEDWEFTLTTAERPEIELGDYKKKVQEVTAKTKKSEIWTPGKAEPSDEEKNAQKQRSLNEVLGTLVKTVKCEISDLIVEEELSQRLSKLIDDIQKLGLSVDSYLKSKNITMDDLRNNLKTEIEETYKLEFILGEIAEKENITVEQKDLEALFANIKSEADKKAAQENAYFYASILRKQKVLEFLSSL